MHFLDHQAYHESEGEAGITVHKRSSSKKHWLQNTLLRF